MKEDFYMHLEKGEVSMNTNCTELQKSYPITLVIS